MIAWFSAAGVSEQRDFRRLGGFLDMPCHVERPIDDYAKVGGVGTPRDLLALQAQRRRFFEAPKTEGFFSSFGNVEGEPPLRQPVQQQVEGAL